MPSPNITRTHEYLQAVASLGQNESVANFYTADVIIQEFPNRIAPQGRIRRTADLRAAYAQGRKLLQSQRYDVRRIYESGDDVIAELEWTGVLAIPVMDLPVMDLPAGTEMKAYCAMFLTFRDGKIVSQRNYDCYPPFTPQSTPAS